MNINEETKARMAAAGAALQETSRAFSQMTPSAASAVEAMKEFAGAAQHTLQCRFNNGTKMWQVRHGYALICEMAADHPMAWRCMSAVADILNGVEP